MGNAAFAAFLFINQAELVLASSVASMSGRQKLIHSESERALY